MRPVAEEVERKCVHCQFFCRRSRATPPSENSTEMRENILQGTFDLLEESRGRLACYHGIWTSESALLAGTVEDQVRVDRGNDCYFLLYRPGVPFGQAMDTWQIKQQLRQFEQELALSRRSLRIALWALIFTVVLEGCQLLYQLLEFYFFHEDGFLRAIKALVDGFGELW